MRAPAAVGERWIVFALYFLLLAGGLWHALGWFQTAMRALAGAMLAGIALLLALDMARRVEDKRRFALWALLVLAGGFGAEAAGVATGRIFGHYSYSGLLGPKWLDVPLAIAPAWLAIQISSLAVAQRTLRRETAHRIWLTALLMVLFDAVMEPAAVKLGYWTWAGGGVPLRNALAWGLFGLLFSACARILGLLHTRMSTLGMHAYAAQMGYFCLALLNINL